jgi:hypothetical protein
MSTRALNRALFFVYDSVMSSSSQKVIGVCIAGVILWALFNSAQKPVDTENFDDQLGVVTMPTKPVVEKPIIKNYIPQKEAIASGEDKNKNTDIAKKSDKKTDKEGPSEEQMEAIAEHFGKVEKEWNTNIRSFLQMELGLTNEVAEDYLRIRENFYEDQMDAYEEFHENQEEKYGSYFSFDLSPEQDAVVNGIRDEYLEKIQKRLGEENYARYREFIEDFNRRMAKDSADNEYMKDAKIEI